MGKAKDLILKPISSKEANGIVKRLHYSGKVVQNSQLHIGVYYHGKLEGAMQFGPSLDKRKLIGLVEGTDWNEFIELNRMAFSEALPRNSESRAMAIAFKLLKQHAPHLKWVISFADATQCGDGAIYRAAGFVLTGIKENKSQWIFDLTELERSQDYRCKVMLGVLRQKRTDTINEMFFRSEAWSNNQLELNGIYYSLGKNKFMELMGAQAKDGYQLRYIYFLDKSYRQRLTIPEVPFSKIDEMGAGMYRGIKRAGD